MNARAVEALVALLSEQKSTKELAKTIGVTYVRASQIVRQLVQEGFAVREGGTVRLADTAHATLFKKVVARFDPKKLLAGSIEKVAIAVLTPRAIAGIERQTGLSYWTIRRSLVSLMQIGAVKEDDGRHGLVGDEELMLFLRLLNERELQALVEPYAEVVYAGADCLLKKVPREKDARGSPTAFSVFWRYGVHLRPIYQYLLQPEKKGLKVEEVLVHALVFSRSPVEMTDCAIFYAKNRGSIDSGEARELAKKFGVQDALADLKGYVSNLEIPRPGLFLPWEEYAEKARLYDLSPESLVPQPAYPGFAEELGRRVRKGVDVYVFGGEAMRIRGLKRATKDTDIVVEDASDFRALTHALRSMGYRRLGGDETTKADAKLDPSGIFVKEGSPRVDVFVRTVCGKFRLSTSMKRRSECKKHGRLSFCVMSNEDIFLLKSVTDREGDIYDMIQLARAPNFEWRSVANELYEQERITKARFCLGLLDSVEIIQERENIRAPFYDALVNHCMDHAILDAVSRWKATTMAQIKEFVDYPDYRLRSRIEKLIKEGRLTRKKNGELVTPPSPD
ncbi:MAG: hypothetical protein HYY68_06715 [Thaumarchaeota archaeon]|nr:hypothetical protein [Nitrososphaerota archaeon]